MKASLDVEMAKPDAPSFDTSTLKDEDSKQDETYEFKFEMHRVLHNDKLRFESTSLSMLIGYKPFYELTVRQLIFLFDRKTGTCGSMRVSHDKVAETARIENFEGDDRSPLFSAVTFPLACYDKLCKAILEALPGTKPSTLEPHEG